jgi:Zn-dependent M16 (insulinase) family peptidase
MHTITILELRYLESQMSHEKMYRLENLCFIVYSICSKHYLALINILQDSCGFRDN